MISALQSMKQVVAEQEEATLELENCIADVELPAASWPSGAVTNVSTAADAHKVLLQWLFVK
jgi:hypothetical protein